ncbi:hypothetical protein [Streptomyces sp. SPB074]|uniref:hypothetical protein n=1 Tax=Streptomyces sp. (strain SPB074) TaxID=465543 RepID=UPI00017F292E|nr:hypothetical protein [Streptomyces sp. SPB074]EDY43911.1 hypothetical protein SSBG_02101 [Streptomyces sp. SPB074]
MSMSFAKDAAAAVIHEALKTGRTPFGIAVALDRAGMLCTPPGLGEEPSTAERRALLLATIRSKGGEWTPRRAAREYSRLGLPGLQRATIRADFAALSRAGHLTLHEAPSRRHYTRTESSR